MRIRGLHIEGFGKFADFDCGPLERTVTVFLGANEAGKSTLLAFIRRVLFGFPDGRSRRNPYPPMAGGRHGGSVTLVSDADEVVTVRRFSGAGGGTPALSSEAGAPIAATELPKLLGYHSRSVFEQVFAFTLDELHDDALLRDESINSQIYSAGMGATNLPGALASLDQDKRRLFLKGGSKHAIHEVAEAIDRVDSGIRGARDNAERYGRLASRLAQIESKLGELRERRLRIGSELRSCRNLERAWEDWNDLRNAERRLRDLPEVAEFPENGVARLETLDERAASAREAVDHASRRAQGAGERAEVPIEAAAILHESAAVRRIQRARTSFDQSVRDLPLRQADLSALRSRLAKTLAELGPDWTAERLAGFDLSIAAREEVSAHGDRLRTTSENLERRRSAALRAKQALEEASDAVEGARAELHAARAPELDADGIRARRLTLRRAAQTLDEHARAADRGHDLRNQLAAAAEDATPDQVPRSDSSAVAGILVAFGLAGFFLVSAFLGDWAIGATVAALLLAAAAFVHLRARRPAQPAAGNAISARIRRQADDAKRRSNSLAERLAALAGELDIATIDLETLNAGTDALDREETRLAEWTNRNETLTQAETGLRRRRNESEALAKAVENAETARNAAEDNWRRWLAERKLQKAFSPRNIEVLEERVARGRNESDQVGEMEARISDIQGDIDRFIGDLLPITEALDVEADPNDLIELARTADALIESHAEAEKQVRAREAARKELEEAEEELARRAHRLKAVADERAALLQVAGVDNAEEFRRLATVFAERESFAKQLQACADNLRKISGPGADFETLKKRLAAENPTSIAERIDRCEAELKTLDGTRSELDTERGSITNERTGLLGEEASSRLRAEGHRLREKMSGHGREWAVRTIAENLLKEARGRFEKERQPDVLRHSERYFRDMTGGRYRTVFSPLGSSEIHVADDGGSRQPAELSRGTREQLFLSLRFGLIRELGERSERLPVIVDEALVNFDESRGARAARAFTELADRNQVLVFTCHQAVADWFAIAADESGARRPRIVSL